ncbi:NRAMP (natural resistance-associated macrophage protein)-like metal ion transporter [Labedella gwakjiensis]|uniref:NRAMP (Natural resistance-associated macrophage protein)-like metal ion transporter n=1 Tax=Labedella gwakjiensis TaxID=390269 RepID=A0A2P8GUX3_9MICO|nr:NRAMP (natural resistance-associated macrophage protein)-like metal ion transporter [Labedella gwakjiensis]
MSERTKTRHTSTTPGTGYGRISTGNMEAIVGASRRRRSFWQRLLLIGPAFVAGAWQFGPGNLTTAVQAGSGYQYTLVWVIVVSTILMIVLTDMSVRLGIKSPVSLISSIKDHLGKGWGVVAGVGVFLITLMFSVGNAVGSGLGLSMLFGGPPVMWTVVCTVGVATLLLLRHVYRVVEKVLIAIVALMAIAFVVSAFIASPDWVDAAAGLIPSAPEGSWLLIVALVGTNFSINAAFYTSYGTKERGRTEEEYRDVTMVDTIPGIVAPGIMTVLVMMVAAAVLGSTGQAAGTITELAGIFAPLAGEFGSTVFALGFFGAAFSSMIANATAGGTMLSDALGRSRTRPLRRVEDREDHQRLDPLLRHRDHAHLPVVSGAAHRGGPGAHGAHRPDPRRAHHRHGQPSFAHGGDAEPVVAERARRRRPGLGARAVDPPGHHPHRGLTHPASAHATAFCG